MFHKILVPLDGSDLAEAALPHAAYLAKRSEAKLLLARAMVLPVTSPAAWNTIDVDKLRGSEEKATKNYLRKTAERLEKQGLVVQTVAREGEPPEVLLDLAESEGVDLIVMTSHGRTGFKRWLFGSVAEKLVRHSPCPIMTIGSRSLQKD